MGGGGSKPEQHVFNADAPVRFSQSVVDSLQNSSDTDSTRAQDVELKIQSRVNSELKRLRDEQEERLTALSSSLTTQEGAASSQEGQRDPNTLFSHLSSPFFHANKDESAEAKQESNRSHDSVQKEIMDLRQKLESRRKLERANPEVDKAKDALVKCLRTNDRRPLDCWQEVEAFKAEVGKLEHAFIQKAGR